MPDVSADPTAVRPDDLARAARTVARFRRRRRAVLVTGLAVVSFASSRVVVGGSTASLRPTGPAPTSSPTAAAFPWPTPLPSDAPVLPDVPGAVPGATTAPGPVGTTRSPAPVAAPVAVRPRPPMLRTRTAAGPLECLGGGPTQDAPCVSLSTSQQRDGTVRVTYRACHGPDVMATNVTFPTDLEVDFAVWSDTRVIWHWAAGAPWQAHVHGVSIPASSCEVWSTTWDRLAADGRSAYGKGHYRLTASGHDTAGLLARHLALGFQLG